jgi:hypothetical protein
MAGTAQDVTAIQVTIIDAGENAARVDQTVIVRRNRIVEIGLAADVIAPKQRCYR